MGIKIPTEAPVMTAGNHTRQWEQYKAFTFDDSIRHQVHFEGRPGGPPRVVLDVKFIHPDLAAYTRTHEQDIQPKPTQPGDVHEVGTLSALTLRDRATESNLEGRRQLAAHRLIEDTVARLDQGHDGVAQFAAMCFEPEFGSADERPYGTFLHTLFEAFWYDWERAGFDSRDEGQEVLLSQWADVGEQRVHNLKSVFAKWRREHEENSSEDEEPQDDEDFEVNPPDAPDDDEEWDTPQQKHEL